MTFLPIVDRELRVAARRHSTYSLRLLVALVAIVIGFFFYLANLRTAQQLLAHRIFDGLAVLAFLYCLASGRRFTADCLSEEKREGTLGLLFLTELKGHDVVFGKLAATSLNGFLGLLAMFPVLAVPLVIGGITNGDFWRMILVLVTTFLFSLAVGIFASVLSWQPRRAMGANFLWFLLLAGLLPAIAGAIAYFSPAPRVVAPLLFPCPAYAFYLSADIRYRFEIGHFWWSIGIVQAMTWLLVAMASRLAPNSWRDRRVDDGKARWGERWETLVFGGPARRKAFRNRLLNINAFYWLAARAWFKPIGVWLALGFVAGWWLFMRVQLEFNWRDESLSLTTAILLNCLLKLWVAVEAGQRLADDQKTGALELVLSTPLSVRGILQGQLLSLRRQFLGPVLLAIAVELLLMLARPPNTVRMDSRVTAFGLATVLMLLTDLTALIGVAMATALTARSPNHASVSTISRVLILPWLLCGAGAVLTSLWFAMRASTGPGWKFYLGLWVTCGLLADLVFGVPAWRQLQNHFRQLALQRLTPRTPRAK